MLFLLLLSLSLSWLSWLLLLSMKNVVGVAVPFLLLSLLLQLSMEDVVGIVVPLLLSLVAST